MRRRGIAVLMAVLMAVYSVIKKHYSGTKQEKAVRLAKSFKKEIGRAHV